MAKIKDNDIVGDVGGNIGDKSIARTKYGKQLKNKPKKRTYITPGQKKGMNIWGYISSVYDTFTEKEAIWWAQAARDRDIRRLYTKERHLDGRNLFFSVNMKILDLELPIVRTLPRFTHAQSFNKFDIELVEEGKKQDIILKFEPEIEADTVMKITASGGVKENLTFIHPNLYKRIGLLDSNFKSGDSLMKLYLKYYKKLPERGLKIGFEIEVANGKCGTVNMPIKMNIHLYKLPESCKQITANSKKVISLVNKGKASQKRTKSTIKVKV